MLKVNFDKYKSKSGVRQVCKVIPYMEQPREYYAILTTKGDEIPEALIEIRGTRYADAERAQFFLDKSADAAEQKWCGRNEEVPTFVESMNMYHRFKGECLS